jgi:hypothetical protein
MCTTEALKLVTGAGPTINNNLLYSAEQGAFMQHFFFARKPDCSECSRRLLKVPAVMGETVQQLMSRLAADFGFPATGISAGQQVVYMRIVADTADNLEKPIADFVAPDVVVVASGRGREPMEFVLEGI